MTIEFWIQMVVYALTAGLAAGRILTKIGYLEKKIDTFSDFGERMVAAEETAKSAHFRIDALERPPVKRKKAR